MKLLLKTLRLIGVRKNYEVHFHKGLNYISGPTSTGKTAEVENYETVQVKSVEIDSKLEDINSKIENYKSDILKTEVGNDVNELIVLISDQKEKLSNLRNKFLDQEQYIQKLQLLENQYFADIEKISEQIAGIKAINKYEYLYCPNCLRPISLHEESSCLLCHQNMDDIVIEINDLKKERKNLQKRKMSFTLILIQKKKKILE